MCRDTVSAYRAHYIHVLVLACVNCLNALRLCDKSHRSMSNYCQTTHTHSHITHLKDTILCRSLTLFVAFEIMNLKLHMSLIIVGTNRP